MPLETLDTMERAAPWQPLFPRGRARRSPGSVLFVEPRTLSDAELARGIVRSGDPALERELVLRFRPRVVLFARRHTRDAALAEDIAQEVLTTVLQRLRSGEVDDPERIGSFILGTARWTVHGKRRQNRRAQELSETLALATPFGVEQKPALDSESLARALSTLSERERAIVVMSFLEDQSAERIAEAFSLSPGNVRVIRHRAVARLGLALRSSELSEETALSEEKGP